VASFLQLMDPIVYRHPVDDFAQDLKRLSGIDLEASERLR
jgi:hypothetical protein